MPNITIGPITERLRELRVGYIGAEPRVWLGSNVSTRNIRRNWEPSSDADEWVDVLVVGRSNPDSGPVEIADLIGQAKSSGIRVVGFMDGGVDPVAARKCDLLVAPHGSRAPSVDLALKPLVDLSRISPVGSLVPQDAPTVSAVNTRTRQNRKRSSRFVEQFVTGSGNATDADPWNLNLRNLGPRIDLEPIIPELRETCGIVDDSSLHASDGDRARFLAQLAIASVPVALIDRPSSMGGGEVPASLLASMSIQVNDLHTDDSRQRHSVAQRRIAFRHFTDWQRWSEITGLLGIADPSFPKVSVMLATNRPSELPHALDQILAQKYGSLEPIILLHGSGFDDAPIDTFRHRIPSTQVIAAESNVPFGEVLNMGIRAATGDLVTKMDDDDWYGAEHVQDLVDAMEYSQATLVGKASEWVYLSELDITVRRHAGGAEASGKVTLAGGAMMLRRADLIAVGGFRRAKRHVDLGLLRDVRRYGGTTYRTHGFGYLLNRRSEGHTWDIDTDYFLKGSSTQIRGFAAEDAMVVSSKHAPSDIGGSHR